MHITKTLLLFNGSLNYNIRFHILYTLLSAVGRGIWLGNMLSLYIVSFLETSNTGLRLHPSEVLGILSAGMGFAATLVVLPAGFLADTLGRERIIRAAAFIGMSGLLVIPFSFSITALSVALILCGLFEGISKPAIDSLIANSIPTGRRSGSYCMLHVIDQIGMALGPFINVALFVFLENAWDFRIIRNVMLWGNAVSFVSLTILFFYKDDKSIGRESEAVFPGAHLGRDSAGDEEKSFMSLLFMKNRVPSILLLSNIVMALGAGMTIKFIPIYFKTIYHLKPVMIQLIFGTTSICTGFFSIAAQRLARRKGRVGSIIAVQLTAIVCLFAFASYPPLAAMVILFVARGSLMNATLPLSNSILMDVISKKNRSKWSSVNTLSGGISWNCSAVLGGFLIGKDNFKLCFLSTACIYLIGLVPMFLLIPIVNSESEKTPGVPATMPLHETVH